jgi:hypothetical protein
MISFLVVFFVLVISINEYSPYSHYSSLWMVSDAFAQSGDDDEEDSGDDDEEDSGDDDEEDSGDDDDTKFAGSKSTLNFFDNEVENDGDEDYEPYESEDGSSDSEDYEPYDYESGGEDYEPSDHERNGNEFPPPPSVPTSEYEPYDYEADDVEEPINYNPSPTNNHVREAVGESEKKCKIYSQITPYEHAIVEDFVNLDPNAIKYYTPSLTDLSVTQIKKILQCLDGLNLKKVLLNIPANDLIGIYNIITPTEFNILLNKVPQNYKVEIKSRIFDNLT